MFHKVFHFHGVNIFLGFCIPFILFAIMQGCAISNDPARNITRLFVKHFQRNPLPAPFQATFHQINF